MGLVPEVKQAVKVATERVGQPGVVADLLTAWIEQLSSGNETLEDPEAVSRQLDLIFEALEATRET